MDKKLTDAEIVKALECCRHDDYDYCEECPYRKNKPCQENLIQDTFDLINRQKAEIESLIKLNKLESEIVADKGKEIERLKEEKARVHKVIPKMIKTAKAEAYKEFVNKIKVHAYYIDFPKEHRVVDEDDIDNLLKELVGE